MQRDLEARVERSPPGDDGGRPLGLGLPPPPKKGKGAKKGDEAAAKKGKKGEGRGREAIDPTERAPLDLVRRIRVPPPQYPTHMT